MHRMRKRATVNTKANFVLISMVKAIVWDIFCVVVLCDVCADVGADAKILKNAFTLHHDDLVSSLEQHHASDGRNCAQL